MRRIWRWLGTVGAVVAVAVISDVTSAWADSIGPVTEQVNPSDWLALLTGTLLVAFILTMALTIFFMWQFWIENKPHFTGFVIWVLASIAIGTGLVISASSYFRS
jgi:hypothetical protein